MSFYRQQGAAELVPYLCAIDKIASDLLGWGLRRTMVLAEGSAKCNFRFNKGGMTCVMIPHSLGRYANQEERKMSTANSPTKGYVLATVLGAMIGGLFVALAAKAIPRILAQTMALLMQKMIAQMKAKSCSPSEM